MLRRRVRPGAHCAPASQVGAVPLRVQRVGDRRQSLVCRRREDRSRSSPTTAQRHTALAAAPPPGLVFERPRAGRWPAGPADVDRGELEPHDDPAHRFASTCGTAAHFFSGYDVSQPRVGLGQPDGIRRRRYARRIVGARAPKGGATGRQPPEVAGLFSGNNNLQHAAVQALIHETLCVQAAPQRRRALPVLLAASSKHEAPPESLLS